MNFSFKISVPSVSKEGMKEDTDHQKISEMQSHMDNALDEIEELLQKRMRPVKEGNQQTLFNNIRRK